MSAIGAWGWMRGSLPYLAAGLGAATSAWAHDGKVATAAPVDGIQLDGALDEWPAELPERFVDAYLGEVPLGVDDHQARFRLAYDVGARALLLGVRVEDDVHAVAAQGEAGDEDRCTVLLDVAHVPGGKRPMRWSAALPAGADSAALEVSSESYGGQARCALRRHGTETFYEWWLPLGDGGTPGRTLGFQVQVDDFDGPGEEKTTASWQAVGYTRQQLGDVVLLEEPTPLGTLSGRAQCFDASVQPTPRWVEVTSVDSEGLWVHVELSSTGNYTVDLPPGTYRVGPALSTTDPFGSHDSAEPRRVDDGSEVQATVTAGTTTTAEPLTIFTLDPPRVAPDECGLLYRYEPAEGNLLDAWVEELMDYYAIPGAALALVSEGEVVYHRVFGLADAAEGKPVTKQTLFEAASITKPMFAFAVMRLVERGEFDLDKPLFEYQPFPNFVGDERAHKLTARHVLSHQTGMPNWAFGGVGRWRDGGPYRLSFEPGTDFGYSGEGFDYLGRVVAHVLDVDLERWLQEEVVGPLGLGSVYFSDSDALDELRAMGHWGGYVNHFSPPDIVSPASSMHIEPIGMSRFIQALCEGRGLEPGSLAELWSPQRELEDEDRLFGDGWDRSVGLGFFLQESPHGLMVEHGGANGDFHCKFGAFVEADMGYAIFTNGNHGFEMVRELERLLVGIGGDTPEAVGEGRGD